MSDSYTSRGCLKISYISPFNEGDSQALLSNQISKDASEALAGLRKSFEDQRLKVNVLPIYVPYIDRSESENLQLYEKIKEDLEENDPDVVFLFGDDVARVVLGSGEELPLLNKPIFLLEYPNDDMPLPLNCVRIGRTAAWTGFFLRQSLRMFDNGLPSAESNRYIAFVYLDSVYGRLVKKAFEKLQYDNDCSIKFDCPFTQNISVEEAKNIVEKIKGIRAEIKAIIFIGYGNGYDIIKNELLQQSADLPSIVTDRFFNDYNRNQEKLVSPIILLRENIPCEYKQTSSYFLFAYDAGVVLCNGLKDSKYNLEALVKSIFRIRCFENTLARVVIIHPFGDVYFPAGVLYYNHKSDLSEPALIHLEEEKPQAILAHLLQVTEDDAIKINDRNVDLNLNDIGLVSVLNNLSETICSMFLCSGLCYLEGRRDVKNRNFHNYFAEDGSLHQSIRILSRFIMDRGLGDEYGYGIGRCLPHLKEICVIQNSLGVLDIENNDSLRLYVLSNTGNGMEWEPIQRIANEICKNAVFVAQNDLNESLRSYYGKFEQEYDRIIRAREIKYIALAKTPRIAQSVFQRRFDSVVSETEKSFGANTVIFRLFDCDLEENVVADKLILKSVLFANIVLRNILCDTEYGYLILIPSNDQPTNPLWRNSGCFLYVKRALTFLDVRVLATIVNRIYSPIHVALQHRDIKIANTKSAIGSIMSRNGSHNIGSHVLSALSHNVGTMPDDRVLYQYIQHRMDYIATATTEFPQWTTPTMFVAGLMKNFYSQKHLLDYISRSEGLRAYKFQERNLDDAARMNQHGTIRIFLRRFYELGKMTETDQKELPDPNRRYLTRNINDEAWSIYYFFGEKARMFQRKSSSSSGKRVQYAVSESGGTAQFLEYDEQFTPDWKQDVRLAIPGGIVGRHAFYTILENVIRNAAKHGWASKAGLREKDLEINIDFQEKDDAIVFTVGDNMSDVFGAAKDFWGKFFKEFDPDKESDSDEEYRSVKKWKHFLEQNPWIQNPGSAKGEDSANQHGNIFSEGEQTEDEKSLAKWWRDILDAVDDTKFNVRTEDEKQQSEDNARRFLPRLFVAPLTSDDAEQLERYLRPKENDRENSKKEDEEDDNLPLRYQLLRAFLEETVADGKKRWEDFKPFLTNNEPKHRDSELGRRLILPLHHDQHRKLAQPFIDKDGTLRKENWGLAEMKISAGYLAQRPTPEIGGLDAKGNDILVPVAMPSVCRNADNPHNCLMCGPSNPLKCYKADGCPVIARRFHLGYRFRIGKPKDILVIVPIVRNGSNPQESTKHGFLTTEQLNLFAKEGIHFVYAVKPAEKPGNTESVILSCYDFRNNKPIEAFNYRYVVIHADKESQHESSQAEETRQEDDLLWQFGFRRVESDKVSFQGKKPSADDDDKCKTYCLSDIINKKTNPEMSVRDLRIAVQSAWVRKLAAECQKDHNLRETSVKLVVNVDGNEAGSERGLVTREDLLRTMFLECYHTALISFIKNPPETLSLGDTTRHLVTLLSLIKVMPESEYMVKPQQDYGHGDDKGAKEYIRAQLARYCDLLKSHLHLSVEFIEALESIVTYVKDEDGRGRDVVARKIEDIGNDFEKAIARRIFRGRQDDDETVRKECAALIPYLQTLDKDDLDKRLDAFHCAGSEFVRRQQDASYGPGRHSFAENIRAVIRTCSAPEEDEFSALVESLNSMFLASDVYLRKYEERIATLPEAYRHDGSELVGNQEVESQTESLQDIADRLLTGCLPDKGSGEKFSRDKIVKYSRHDSARPNAAIYTEALSGSQSYLNALARLTSGMGEDAHGERHAAVARLLENAFLRILIVDERVMNFVNDRRSDRMIETFINMGIWVADVETEGVPEGSSMVTDKLYRFHHFPLKDDVEKSEDAKKKDKSDCVDVRLGQFDILVIHQGIIDKWWEQHKHDKDKVCEILKDIRRSIPRVVVTTGRGRPDNIPDHEKVLPFSVIESSLFRRYPEKLILVNTIMNLLPYGKKGGEE